MHTSSTGAAKPRAAANFFAGATSGAVTTLLLQPLDVAKTRMQMSAAFNRTVGLHSAIDLRPNTGILATIRGIIRSDRLRGLWRGVSPTILRNMTGVGIYFVSLTKLTTYLRNPDGTLSDASTLLAGACARSAAVALLCPLSVVKTRFEAVELAGKYTGIFNAIYTIAKKERLKGLFSGLSPAIARDAPYSALYMLLYLRTKEALGRAVGMETASQIHAGTAESKSPTAQTASTSDMTTSGGNSAKLSFIARHPDLTKVVGMAVNFASGGFGGGIATLLTQPQDVVKTRMQLSRHTIGRHDRYASVRQTAYRVFKEEGLYGFFRGASPRFLKRCLGSAITWMIYEETVMFYERMLQARDDDREARLQATAKDT
eukprot:Plantae.Rhodophyta-Hildenbrandia_rubra.ctg7962.p2 GENE.Plantae.Rhodophyta-Hildenbrandia_rubra.ctg7962~~Plantae.Rhodophyta-Hildenbrandia_rubra.ctg7962.p2  ORF type:complete len:373 (-),score=46.32 Plantae.Rhodophyta-Hildenbrandia_rubra.ctg7962:1318-2436(-)